MKHASTALIALSRTKLISFRSIASIHAVLFLEDCVSCQKYAPFLFLPTCERCCYECLHRDRSLRVVTTQMAGICFGISPKDLRRIPAMLSIPGTYSVGHEVTRRRRVKLVSLKQVRELGIAMHGSDEAMKSFFTSRNAEKLASRARHTAGWFTASSSESRPRQSSTSSSYATNLTDQFCGVASSYFPSLGPNNILEN